MIKTIATALIIISVILGASFSYEQAKRTQNRN
jgi:hypothetical protein